MSTKDNFSQAMKELLNGEGPAEQEEIRKPAPSSFSSFSQPEPKPPRAPAPEAKRDEGDKVAIPAFTAPAREEPRLEPEPVRAPMPAHAPISPIEYRAAPAAGYNQSSSVFSAPARPMSAPAPSVPPAPMPPAGGSGDTTVIAPGTTVVGDMSTAGGLRVGGSIKGNLRVASMMELNGKVIGDIEATDAVIVGSMIRGNVTVSNVLTMDGETTIVGDVSAKNVDINGKIKGNLTVEERSHFQSNAVLVGNLMSGTVIIDEGAMLKGDISITSAQTESVTVDEPEFDID